MSEKMYKWSLTTTGEAEKIEEVPIGAKISEVNGKKVISYCDNCSSFILEGDNVYEHPDDKDVILCIDCRRKAMYGKRQSITDRRISVNNDLNILNAKLRKIQMECSKFGHEFYDDDLYEICIYCGYMRQKGR